MREDKLKQYIQENRDEFDIEEFNEDVVWQGINQEMRSKKRHFSLGLQWAAILLPIIGLSFYFLMEKGGDNIEQQDYSLADISPELAKIEADYQSDIEVKWAKLEVEELDEEKRKFLEEELKVLEEISNEYKSEVVDVDRERLINVLIDYYEKKTRILEKILIEIEREKLNDYERNSIEL